MSNQSAITRIRALRITGIAEGISFLVLLLIAMPLKYFLGLPMAVKVVGWLHGLLFILYIPAVLIAFKPMRWKFSGLVIALGASLVPLGTFFLDSAWKKRERELKSLETPGV